jgi:hypothetical protein
MGWPNEKQMKISGPGAMAGFEEMITKPRAGF